MHDPVSHGPVSHGPVSPGTTLLAILAASASYIAAPAAVRISLPQANPGISLAAAIGITFPFNITFGIPVYHHLAQFLHAQAGT